jgi:hypothetical protein
MKTFLTVVGLMFSFLCTLSEQIPRRRCSSNRVKQEKFLLGIAGAALIATKQFVFAGLATTKTYNFF